MKLLDKGTSESVRPFKPADSALIRPARPQAHSLVGTVQQIPFAHSAGKTDSAKPSWTGLNLPTSLLGDVAPFSRSVSEVQPFRHPLFTGIAFLTGGITEVVLHWQYPLAQCQSDSSSISLQGLKTAAAVRGLLLRWSIMIKLCLLNYSGKYSFHGVKIKVQNLNLLQLHYEHNSPGSFNFEQLPGNS